MAIQKHFDEARVGKRVRTLGRLIALSEKRRAVLNTLYGRPTPASMVVHLPAILLHRQLKSGVIFEYEKHE